MSDIRTKANADAQRAFRRLLDHHFAHGEWHPALLADWHAAEATFDETPEWLLDAHFDAVMSEMDELADAETDRLPDVPLAIAGWAPGEIAEVWGK